ncbi:MAG TPA: helix-turn-helix transcriptional regulator [Anaerovoracaceae bacterium]|nr:helix-turn-helix transcriptional regulator [Anaerovoracaceae bacterium]
MEFRAFGDLLRDTLRKQNKTVTWLSDKTGIPSTTLYSIIKRGSSPRTDTLEKVTTALGMSISKFLNFESGRDKDRREVLLLEQLEMLGYDLYYAEQQEDYRLVIDKEEYRLSLDEMDTLELDVESYLNFKIQELLKKHKTGKHNKPHLEPIAAHNEDNSPEEIELMKNDLKDL